MIRLLPLTVLALALMGCQGRGPGAGPAGTPTVPVGATSPAASHALRVAVVDFIRVAQAHPRWGELDALNHRIAELEAELALPPMVQVPLPQMDLGPQMRAEVERELEQLRPEFRQQFEQEAAALQDAAKRELDAYVAKVRADEEAEFETRRAALEAQTRKAVQDKQDEATKDMGQFEQQTLEQYRMRLVNLRLKTEAVQQTDRQEAERLSSQLQELTKERDGKIAAHDKEVQTALEEFQQQQTQQYTAAVADLQKQLSAEGQRLIDQKAAELNARLHDQLAARQAALNTEMNARLRAELQAREQALVASAREQVGRAQEQANAAARARVQALQAQLQAAQLERARFLETILAEARIEAAALAQEKGYDLILTQALGTVDAVDATDDLITRIKR